MREHVQPVHIGNVIRNAVVFNFKNLQVGNLNGDSLPGLVTRLFGLLRERKIDYLLVGGIAMLQYVEGRNTEDIDLIMALPSLGKLPEIEVTSQEQYFACGRFDELQIDLRLTRNPLFEKVRQEYATVRPFLEQEIPCATVEGLLLLKLYALPCLYRQGNFARVGLYENDIATLLFTYRPQMEPLLQELSTHLNDTDISALREILAEIEQRIQRFGKDFNP